MAAKKSSAASRTKAKPKSRKTPATASRSQAAAKRKAPAQTHSAGVRFQVGLIVVLAVAFFVFALVRYR